MANNGSSYHLEAINNKISITTCSKAPSGSVHLYYQIFNSNKDTWKLKRENVDPQREPKLYPTNEK